MPDIGYTVNTPDGKGKVVGLNILERMLQIELFEHKRVLDYTLDEILQSMGKSVQ